MNKSNLSAAEFPPIQKSRALLSRAKGLIPSLSQTLAKGPSQYVQGVSPIYLSRGEGSHVWDVDGNEFIDFNMAIGAVSLGYQYPRVDDAIRAQLECGISFSLMHPLEVEVAEKISEIVPGAECVRFSKTGADVTSAAVRLARAFTGRNKVVSCGYHGWHDWYISLTDRPTGIPNDVRALSATFNYNDIDSLKAVLDNDTACVILEPTLFVAPESGFLVKIKELCQKNGSLLIFDEMWTGFRLSLGGAQEFFEVEADLATFSKAVANGMPLSILSGRRDVMSLLEEKVFFYTTFGGETLSLAAAMATMEEMSHGQVSNRLHELGDFLKSELNELIEKAKNPFLKCIGYGPRTLLTIQNAPEDPLIVKSYIQQELIRRGVLWSGLHVMSYSHSPSDIDYLIECYRAILPKVTELAQSRSLHESLKGEPVKATFRTLSGRSTK